MVVKIPKTAQGIGGNPLLGPDASFEPEGYLKLIDLRERLGRAMFPDTWTGEECSGPFEGSNFGRVFRSRAERDFDAQWFEAVRDRRIELTHEQARADGSNQTLEEFRDSLFIDLGPDAPPFVRDLVDIPENDMDWQGQESRLGPMRKNVEAIIERRSAVEEGLRHALYSGKIQGSIFDEKSGELVPILSHIWGGSDGHEILQKGHAEQLKPVLIRESEATTFLGQVNDDDTAQNPSSTDDDQQKVLTKEQADSAYQSRVSDWPPGSRHPSRLEDEVWARKIGIKPTRSVRALRKEYAPTEWKTAKRPIKQ